MVIIVLFDAVSRSFGFSRSLGISLTFNVQNRQSLCVIWILKTMLMHTAQSQDKRVGGLGALNSCNCGWLDFFSCQMLHFHSIYYSIIHYIHFQDLNWLACHGWHWAHWKLCGETICFTSTTETKAKENTNLQFEIDNKSVTHKSQLTALMNKNNLRRQELWIIQIWFACPIGCKLQAISDE